MTYVSAGRQAKPYRINRLIKHEIYIYKYVQLLNKAYVNAKK